MPVLTRHSTKAMGCFDQVRDSLRSMLIALALSSLAANNVDEIMLSSPARIQLGAGELNRRRNTPLADLAACILRHWVHSHEEDAQGVTVYRPATYSFPPSRGRRGFEFRRGGDLTYYGIAAVDGPEPLSGRWHIEGTNRVNVEVNSDRVQPFALEVLSCDDQRLRAKQVAQ